MKPEASHSDDELVRRFQAGENAALEQLYERHSRSVVLACQRKVRDWATAQELAQDLFVRLLMKPHAYTSRPGKAFGAWLQTVARNSSLNHLKRPHVSRTERLEDCEALHTPVDEDYFSRQELLVALDQLSEKQRLCLKLLYFDERSYSEIGELTGMSQDAVRSAIQNGRLRLQRILRRGAP